MKHGLLAILIVAAFLGGFAASVQLHGDWIVTNFGGQCGAWDPRERRMIGVWSAPDGRCRGSAFIWGRLLAFDVR